ncbi:MAG0480 family ComEC-like protein [Mesomycoplasma lagogenitalium]|uniref:ComEC/Rec2 family competence protein n=1 Tax=Mesomycoplasma lagogenitalium TaxID=171286 RepID=A0ABY8LST3_9BACT|nr:ComEC/Rec2 family competence protein [Mesomycoplasma lagogenitalium]WGI36322.1 ComEC/Rec2 family competence protein [Mesomycoplasma lagogenitalium]
MGRYRKNKWSWWSYFKNTSRKLYTWLILLFSIFLTLLFYEFWNYWFLALIILFTIILAIWKQWLKITILIVAILTLTLYYFFIYKNNVLLDEKIDINTHFQKLNQSEFTFKYKNFDILIKDKNISENYIYNGQFIIEKIDFSLQTNSKMMYLKSKNIFYQVQKINFIKEIKVNDSIILKIKNFLNNDKFYYSKFVPLLLIAEYGNDEKELLDILKKVGIYHIFVISGFHIVLIKTLIEKFFKLLKMKNGYGFITFTSFTLIYLIILNFPVSALRAFIFLLFKEFNKKILKNKFTNIELLTFIALIFFINNIFVIYSYSFILSFFITLIILLINQIKIKNNVFKLLLISVLASIFSTIILNYNSLAQYNLLSSINSILIAPVVSILYILCFLCFWYVDFLDILFNIFFIFLKYYAMWQIFIDVSLHFVLSSSIIALFFIAIPLTLTINYEKFNKNIDKTIAKF